MLVNPGTLLNQRSTSSFKESAAQAMGGLTPLYYFDFVANRAIAGGADVGAISSIPSITGTLALSSSGHLVSGASNGLNVPITGVTYPLTLMVEFIRNTDTGGNEYIAGIDDGDATDTCYFRVGTADNAVLRVDTASVNQASVSVSSVMSSVPSSARRSAARVATSSVQGARSVGTPGQLGTEDTSVTVPATPTRIRIGMDSTGAHSFTGYIRRFGIALTAATDAQLSAIAINLNA